MARPQPPFHDLVTVPPGGWIPRTEVPLGQGRFAGTTVSSLLPVQRELRTYASPERATASAWFFKTGPGEYGQGDVFIGVSVPDQRRVARSYRDLPLPSIARLLASGVHEDRLLAAILLADRARRKDAPTIALGRFYLDHLDRFNNWDIVDTSAPPVLGPYFRNRSRRALDRLAASPNVWHRRVAVLTAGAYIREGRFDDTLRLAKHLLQDPHDLIHKATGWMLREVGKRDRAALRRFLDDHAPEMPRTMLRYAIEKLPAAERGRYLAARERSG